MWMTHELNKFNFLNIKRVPVPKSQFFKRLHFGGPTLEVPRWSHLISFWPSDNFLNWDQINVMIPNYRTDLTLKPFNQWSSMKTNSGITYFGFTLGLFSDNQISIGADCSFNLFNIMSDTSNSNLALLPHQCYYLFQSCSSSTPTLLLSFLFTQKWSFLSCSSKTSLSLLRSLSLTGFEEAWGRHCKEKQ